MAVIDDELLNRYPDLARARGVECTASELSKQWLSWKMKLLDAAIEVLT